MSVLIVPYFLVLVTLILLFFYFIKQHYLLKVVVTCLTFYIASATFFSFETYKGWPTQVIKISDTARVISIVVVEEHIGKVEGKIFAWVQDCRGPEDDCFDDSIEKKQEHSWWSNFSPYEVFGYFPATNDVPLSVEIPYSEDAKKAFQKAQKELTEGTHMVFLKNAKILEGKGKGFAGTEADQKPSSTMSSNDVSQTKYPIFNNFALEEIDVMKLLQK
jgi:hypothetical protein